jgi:hypothetical protein
MVFHLIGTACIAATIVNGGNHDPSGKPIPPVCQELKSPKDYSAYADCVGVVNNQVLRQSEIPSLPDNRFTWFTLHCIQE